MQSLVSELRQLLENENSCTEARAWQQVGLAIFHQYVEPQAYQPIKSLSYVQQQDETSPFWYSVIECRHRSCHEYLNTTYDLIRADVTRTN